MNDDEDQFGMPRPAGTLLVAIGTAIAAGSVFLAVTAPSVLRWVMAIGLVAVAVCAWAQVWRESRPRRRGEVRFVDVEVPPDSGDPPGPASPGGHA